MYRTKRNAPRRQPRGVGKISRLKATMPLYNDACADQDTDAAREQRIDRLRVNLLGASGIDERRSLWDRLKGEIAARSPAQVARLEIAKGLRR